MKAFSIPQMAEFCKHNLSKTVRLGPGDTVSQDFDPAENSLKPRPLVGVWCRDWSEPNLSKSNIWFVPVHGFWQKGISDPKSRSSISTYIFYSPFLSR